MENANNEKELDLIDLIKITWRWFMKYVCHPLFILFTFAIKKWWIGVIGIISGVLISTLICLFFPVYQGSMVLVNNIADSSEFINNIRNFNLTSPEYKSEAMGIPLRNVYMIREIKPHYLCYTDTLMTDYIIDFADSTTKSKTIPLQGKFCIEVEASNDSVFSYFNDGIIRYLNSNPYYQKTNNQRLAEMRTNIKMAETESIRLDSIMNKKGDDVLLGFSSTGNMMTSMVKPAEIVNEKLKLGNMILGANNVLAYQNEMVYISSKMQVYDKPKNFVLRTVKKNTILSILLCYAIALLIVYRENIKQFINRENNGKGTNITQ